MPPVSFHALRATPSSWRHAVPVLFIGKPQVVLGSYVREPVEGSSLAGRNSSAHNPRTRILLVRALPRAPSRAYHGVRTRYTAIKCIRTTAAYKTSGYI